MADRAPLRMTVFDCKGRVCAMRDVPPASAAVLDESGLPRGYYIAGFRDVKHNGFVANVKFIRQAGSTIRRNDYPDDQRDYRQRAPCTPGSAMCQA